MAEFFCADESRRAGEDLIGSAGPFAVYAMIECPPPWAGAAFASPQIPESLRAALGEIARTKASIRPLLIHQAAAPSRGTRVLVFRAREGLSEGYSGEEFVLPGLGGVGALAKDYMAGRPLGLGSRRTATRDLFVCTHGTNDKCCGRYGMQFYEDALRTVRELGLVDVRVWQTSHLGGHRFAPTMLDFPEGRCYGALDRASLVSILTRSGSVDFLRKVYRGWAYLPGPAQVLERELFLEHGWAWLGYEVTGKVLEQDRARGASRVEIAFRRPDGSSGRYRAEIVPDEKRTITLVGDCHRSDPSGPVSKRSQFAVRDRRLQPDA